MSSRWYPKGPPNSSDYRKRIRRKEGLGDATDFEIEMTILRQWEWLHHSCTADWRWFKELGTEKWEHRVACVLSWDDQFRKNPWTDLIFKNVQRLGPDPGQKQLLNIIGSQNSTKSNSCAHLVVQLLIEDPSWVGCYIASPYKEATKLGIWAKIKTCFRSCAPHMGYNADNCIKASGSIVVNSQEEAGWIQVVSVDKVGMLQGKKPRSTERGALYLLVEESGAFDKTPAMAVWDVLTNLQGLDNFHGLSTCNFKSIFGLDGMMCRPVGRDYVDLDVEKDQFWDSVGNGFTMRLDGHRSPNIGIGRGKKAFKFIVGQGDIDKLVGKGFGPKSGKYMEQIRSFPVTGLSVFTVTTRTKLLAGNVFQDAIYDHYPNHSPKWMFADPSLGGDAFRLAIGELKRLQTGQIVLKPIGLPALQIDHDRSFGEVEIAQANSLNPGHPYRLGDKMSPEVQGAIQTANVLRDHGIPAHQFGYDGSMRASVQRAMDMFIGPDSLAMDYIGSAPDSEMPSGIGLASKLYANFITYLWFLAADMLENGIMREGDMWLEAFDQLCQRQWEWAGSRKKMETKDSYKARNSNVSPDEGDSVVGLNYLVYERAGIFERETNTPEGANAVDWLIEKAKTSAPRRGMGNYRDMPDRSPQQSIASKHMQRNGMMQS